MPQNNILDTTENCRYCLMCRHMCPVGNVTHNESLTPHGWGLMVASERRGLFDWDKHSVDAMYKCADCGSCEAHCVTDQPLPDAIAEARKQIVEKGVAPDAVKKMSEKLDATPNLYNGKKPEKPSGKGEIALFVGDEPDYFAPGMLNAVNKLLEKCGINPVLIGQGRNDGFIPSGLGLKEHAETLAKATVEDIKATGAKKLLVLSPQAYFTFKRIYPERLGISIDNHVEVVEVVSILEEYMNAGKLKFNNKELSGTFTYIDPSHAIRVKDRHEYPRNLMKNAFAGNFVEVFWRKERAGTVGNTGLQFSHPQLADDLTKARLKEAKEAGAKIIFTEDAGTCGHLIRNAGDFDIEVRNLYEALAERS